MQTAGGTLPVYSQCSTQSPSQAVPQAQQAEADERVAAQAPPHQDELAAFDVYAVQAKHQDPTEQPSFQVKRYRRAAPTASQASSRDSFMLIEEHASASQFRYPCPKAPGLTSLPDLQAPRLSNPRHRVQDLAVPGSACSIKPQFTVKYPSHQPGTPKPPPVFSKRTSLRQHPSQLGGAPAPQAKPRPKSMPHIQPRGAEPSAISLQPPPAPRVAPVRPLATHSALRLPQARIPKASSSRAASDARRSQMQVQLMVLVGEHCHLSAILSASSHSGQHLQQLLAPFAASTLYRYISNCTAFADFLQAENAPLHQLPIALVVDFLYACTSSAEQDRAIHRTSAGSAVKSLRWLATCTPVLFRNVYTVHFFFLYLTMAFFRVHSFCT